MPRWTRWLLRALADGDAIGRHESPEGAGATATAPAPTAVPAGPADQDGEKDRQEKSDKTKEEAGHLQVYDEIQVTDRASDMLGIADSASEGRHGQKDLEKRPILRPGELLETVPGVIITQHSGGGKANQYFLRGFNLDHGTDFRDHRRRHAGQHAHARPRPGLQRPQLPDPRAGRVPSATGRVPTTPTRGTSRPPARRASATSPRCPRASSRPRPAATATAGSSPPTPPKCAGGDLLGAVEYGDNDGPGIIPDDFRKVNGLLRWNRGDAAQRLHPHRHGLRRAMEFDRPDPRARRRRRPDRAASASSTPTDGGELAPLQPVRRAGGAAPAPSLTRASGYVLRYGLNLFSNFTYFLDDPVNGDQFEQSTTAPSPASRWSASGCRPRRQSGGRDLGGPPGARRRHRERPLPHPGARAAGARPGATTVDEISAGPYAQARVRWNPWLRTVTGLRADYLPRRRRRATWRKTPGTARTTQS